MSLISIPGFAEPFSSLSHLIGAAVFLLLSVPLLRRGRGDSLRIAGLAVFCFGAVFLLSTSGVYHLLPLDSPARSVLQRLDHAAIFVLIASSFTPIHMILFRGWSRWGMLALIWALSITAIVLKMIYFYEMPTVVGLSLYLGMGWMGLGSGGALWRRNGFRFVEFLFWGGMAYSIGAVLEFLHWPVIIPGVLQWHEVFHVAVLIALTFHWAFIYSIADGRQSPPADDVHLLPEEG